MARQERWFHNGWTRYWLNDLTLTNLRDISRMGIGALFKSVIAALYIGVFAYWAYIFTFCLRCSFSGDMLLLTMILLFFSPLFLGGFAAASLPGRVRAVKAAGSGNNPVRTTREVIRASWNLAFAVVSLFAFASVAWIFLKPNEPGRDSLGRICTQEGSSTVCRPDPEADRPSELDQLNERLNRQRERGW